MKWREMGRHVADMGELRTAYKNLLGKEIA
jgi:hypothetical protein